MRKLGNKGSLVGKNSYEFIVITDIYEKDPEDVDGEKLILKRENVKCRYTCPISDINSVEDAFSKTGRKYRNKCVVSLRDRGTTLINDRYDTIQKLISGEHYTKEIIGFKKYE